jgi:hypothetical protein
MLQESALFADKSFKKGSGYSVVKGQSNQETTTDIRADQPWQF